MKNHVTKGISRETTPLRPTLVAAGLDVSDRTCELCIVGEDGEVTYRATFRTTLAGLAQAFDGRPPMRIALEVGTHSRWITGALAGWGHEVIVANPRKLRLISENDSKGDPVDAELLARLARVDPKLLSPIRHRSEAHARALAVVRARDPFVRARVSLVNHVRGAVKPVGGRIEPCSTETFGHKAAAQLPRELADVLQPILDQITALTETIRSFDRRIEKLATEHFPETAPLRQIPGVGALTALAFVLTLDDPTRTRGGCLPGTASAAGAKRPGRSAAADHQGRRSVPARALGPVGALHAGSLRSRQRLAALGFAAREAIGAGDGRGALPEEEEPDGSNRQEKGGRRHGPQAQRRVVSTVGDASGLRAVSGTTGAEAAAKAPRRGERDGGKTGSVSDRAGEKLR